MSQRFPLVPLGQVIRHRKEFAQISDLETYKRCRVQLHAKGIVLRDVVPGSEIKTKSQQVCRTGEFLVAEIDAKVGGFGIVPGDLDGAIVSSHYFLFEIDDTRLDRRFLDFIIRTPAFREQVSAQGSTNYAAIRPNDVLGYHIPLPPREKQRRIVARIEEVAAKIAEVSALRRGTVKDGDALVRSARQAIVERLRRTYKDRRLGDLCVKITDGPHVSPQYVTEGVPFISVRNISETGIDFTSAKFITRRDHEILSKKTKVERGDVLYTKGGTTGVACRVDTDHEFSIWVHVALLKLNRALVLEGFVEQMLNAPSGRAQALEYTHGSSNKDLGLTRMCNIVFPVPPLREQRRVVSYLDSIQANIDGLRTLQLQTTAELHALLPSLLRRALQGEL